MFSADRRRPEESESKGAAMAANGQNRRFHRRAREESRRLCEQRNRRYLVPRRERGDPAAFAVVTVLHTSPCRRGHIRAQFLRS
jgi:hypothetical protein